MAITPDAIAIAAQHQALQKAHGALVSQIQQFVEKHADNLSVAYIEGDPVKLTAQGIANTKDAHFDICLGITRDRAGENTQELNIWGEQRARYRASVESGPSVTKLCQDLEQLSTGFSDAAVIARAYKKRFIWRDQEPTHVYDAYAENSLDPNQATDILRRTITVTPHNPNNPTLGHLLRRRLGSKDIQLR